jgi:hypothetical protein
VPPEVTRALADGLAGASGRRLHGHGAPVTAVRCAADGTIVSRDADGETRRWRLGDGALLERWAPGDAAAPPSGPGLAARVAAIQAITGERDTFTIVPGPDGALHWGDGPIGELRARDGSVRATLHGPIQPGIAWGAFTKAGALTASEDDTLWRWDPTTGRPLGTFQLHERNPLDIEVCPDELHVVVGSRDHTVGIWNVIGGAASLALRVEGVRRASWAGSTLLVSAGFALGGHDARTGAPVAVPPGDHWLPWERRPQGDYLADGDPSHLIGLAGAPDRPLEGVVEHPPICGRWTRDGSLLAAGNDDGTVSLWRSDGTLVRRLGSPGPRGYCPAFSPDGALMVVGFMDAHPILFEVATGAARRTLEEQEGTVWSGAWSDDGARFATASYDHTVALWSRDGQLLHLLRGHASLVRVVAFSPDGRRLASGGDDATIHLWDVATGEIVAVLRGHTEVIRSIAFSPDGHQIVSSTYGGVVLVHPASPTALVEAARAIVGDR